MQVRWHLWFLYFNKAFTLTSDFGSKKQIRIILVLIPVPTHKMELRIQFQFRFFEKEFEKVWVAVLKIGLNSDLALTNLDWNWQLIVT